MAMTAFFVGTTFYLTLTNIGIFLLFLMLSGSVYGLLYSFVLYSKDFKKVNVEMQKVSRGQGWALVAGLIVMALGFVSFIFLVIGIIAVLTMGLYVFAKGLEAVSMIKVVSGKELREGDWLVDDIKAKGKTIKADWDGLSLNDIKLLKGKKKVKIKDGLPFVPAFLIAFLGYVFLKDYVLGLIANLI